MKIVHEVHKEVQRKTKSAKNNIKKIKTQKSATNY